MQKKRRRVFSPELKYKIVTEGLQTNVRISELCRHYGIYPVDYYRWKKIAENAILNDFKKNKKKEKKLTLKEQQMQDEIERLQRVIIQLTKEHVELKKKVYGSE
jgi:transposase-like protein